VGKRISTQMCDVTPMRHCVAGRPCTRDDDESIEFGLVDVGALRQRAMPVNAVI
jgi:hypothetical protein